ncbi:MAG: hypothetical protein CR997_01010 [Acidobacteria bacterium]|nr:MAG: hypothetical protein CR997_01010 [Acidobacteriota bacterium]
MAKHNQRRVHSFKESTKVSMKKKKKLINARMNVGLLMRKYKGVDDLLFSKTSNLDIVFEDMDFSIEEFSDITGCDLEELLEELELIVSGRV